MQPILRESPWETRYGFRLVAGRPVVAGEFELHGKSRMFFPASVCSDSTSGGEAIKILKSGQKTFPLTDVFSSGKGGFSVPRAMVDEAASGGAGQERDGRKKKRFFSFSAG